MSLHSPPCPSSAFPSSALPISFPVRRVYCVGRNYAAHAREMGFDPDREPPFFFCKPNDDASIVPVPEGTTATLPYPPLTKNYHFEAELVVAIGKGGRDIAGRSAAQHIYGYAAGLDMTRRDLQIADARKGPPVGSGQGLRLLCAHRAGAPRGRHATGINQADADHARGRRRGAPAGHIGAPDLVGERGDRQPLDAVHAAARRPDLHRHARRRGPGATPARRWSCASTASPSLSVRID
jgi:hypothetical protein